jgi:hypothetical protein
MAKPLHGDRAELAIEVSLEATSESRAIKKSTLEMKARGNAAPNPGEDSR